MGGLFFDDVEAEGAAYDVPQVRMLRCAALGGMLCAVLL